MNILTRTAALIAFTILPIIASATPQPLDRIVAIVNDDVIVQSELNERMADILAQLAKKGAELPPRNVIERQVLERLIVDRLQLQDAKQSGVTVTDDTLTRALANIAKENGLSLAEFRDALERQGIDFGRFRDNLRDEITISRLRNSRVRNQVTVSEQELEAFLRSYPAAASQRTAFHLYHILISTPDAAAPETIQAAKRKAERLVREIRGGREFRSAALSESDGRQALEGGDLGWLQAAQVPTLFADLVNDMERGAISDPIRSPSGYHIIMLEDFKGGERHILTQTHARHILIQTNEVVSNQDAQTRLEHLKQRIEGGEDFATLARSHSDDQASAVKGGDLGWTSPGDLVPRFEEEMNQLSPGQVSAPFQTDFGWHIVQLLERRQHDSTEEVRKAEAREQIRNRKVNEEVELWLRRLRDTAYIEIRLEDS